MTGPSASLKVCGSEDYNRSLGRNETYDSFFFLFSGLDVVIPEDASEAGSLD